MSNVYLSQLGGAAAQFFDNNGVILSGGKLYTYAAGTTDPQPSYTSVEGDIPHTNPIILDSAGRVPSGGEIWLDTLLKYKFVLTTSDDTLIGTWDNISTTMGSATLINLRVVEEATFEKDIAVERDAMIGRDLSVDRNVTIDREMSVASGKTRILEDGSIVIGDIANPEFLVEALIGALRAKVLIETDGNIEAGTHITAGGTVTGKRVVSGGDIEADGDAVITGEIVSAGGATILGKINNELVPVALFSVASSGGLANGVGISSSGRMSTGTYYVSLQVPVTPDKTVVALGQTANGQVNLVFTGYNYGLNRATFEARITATNSLSDADFTAMIFTF